MADDDLLLDDEDLDDADDTEDTAADSAEDDSSDDDQNPDLTPERLLARVEALEAANATHARNLTAAIGRYQKLQAKIDSGDDSTKTLRELRAASTASQAAIDAILEDEAIDPAVKARARAARQQAASDSEKQELLDRLDRLENKRPDPTSDDEDDTSPPAVSPFERELWSMITSFGLEITDPVFDWKGEATRILTTQGQDAARAYFTTKIREKLEGTQSSERRQQRKRAAAPANGTPPAGSLRNELDASRPLEDRLKHLQSLGAI